MKLSKSEQRRLNLIANTLTKMDRDPIERIGVAIAYMLLALSPFILIYLFAR